MSTPPDPGYYTFQCRNFLICGKFVRNANTYCGGCIAQGYEDAQDNSYSGKAPGYGISLAEDGMPSSIQVCTSDTEYYDCANGCGNKVRVMNTICTRCLVGAGPPFNNQKYLGSGLAHEVLGVHIPYAEYGTSSGTQSTNDHWSASYPCKNPGCINNVQDRDDLCQVCVAGA